MSSLLDSMIGAVEQLGPDEVRAAVIAVERTRSALDALQVRLVQRFDAGAMAADDGYATTRAWLRQRTHMSGVAASRWVKVARALRQLPAVSEALQAGRFSFEQAHAFAAVLSPRTETAMEVDERALVELGLGLQVDDLRSELRGWADAVDPDGAEPDAGHRSRHVTLSQTLDQQWYGTIELGPADGAVLHSAIARMADWLRAHEQGGANGDPDLERTAGQRRADALIELVRRGAASLEAEAARTRAPRPSIALMVTLEDLEQERPMRTGSGHTVGGAGADRLRCDCQVEPIGWSVDGVPLSHGRTRRLPTAAQRRAAVSQFGGCCFPGCDAPADWADIHHAIPWKAEGGPTDQHNLVPVCSGTHHRLLHEGGWRVNVEADGSLTFLRPDGSVYDPRPGWN